MPIFLIVCASLIAYQDFKHRAVHWMLFVLLLFLSVLTVTENHAILEIAKNGVINLGILAFLWLMLTIYFSVRNQQFVVIMDRYIGWGDAALFIALAFYFTPINFVIFLNTSMFLALIVAVFQYYISKPKNPLIPLAGWVCVFFIIFQAFHFLIPDYPINNQEYWSYSILNLIG